MRTNIELDDSMVSQAMELTGETTKRGVVALALSELVERRERRSLGDLRGQVAFADGYDHRALRVASGPDLS
ncbi:MAG: type II toxin-antitoxin system VapB family antitoxin [Propionibacteriaceae bacterium]|jgi:Arc/MetJ family transcription regulator|nr:type II toxin-antitoxin system VapB family antitoxin [Propionibacteriaceae bacterium]